MDGGHSRSAGPPPPPPPPTISYVYKSILDISNKKVGFLRDPL
jgi:hypothetical protein